MLITSWTSKTMCSTSLDSLTQKALLLQSFLQVLLSSRQFADHPLVVDLVQSCSHTVSLFCTHGAFERPVLQWVHESVEKEYKSEIQELVKMTNGWQFNALHASAEQIDQGQKNGESCTTSVGAPG